jgi:hypothetical protein
MKLKFLRIAEILIVYSKSVVSYPDLDWIRTIYFVDPDPGKAKFPPKKKKIRKKSMARIESLVN